MQSVSWQYLRRQSWALPALSGGKEGKRTVSLSAPLQGAIWSKVLSIRDGGTSKS